MKTAEHLHFVATHSDESLTVEVLKHFNESYTERGIAGTRIPCQGVRILAWAHFQNGKHLLGVSMNKDGYWFADECLPEEMTIDHSWGIHSAPYGADILLNVPKCDTSICDWEKSVAEVN